MRTRTPPARARRKRYDDVALLLDNGIDVWTTVNIQHLESLNSRIRALTGVEVRETFPDRWLHEADEIRLVDLSPRSLRERIARGLVYPADRVDAALKGFFTVENLTALRALVLHELAEVAAAELESLGPGRAPDRARPGRHRRPPRLLRLPRPHRRAPGPPQRLGALRARVEPQDGRVDAETAGVLSDAEALTRSLGGVFLRRRADNPAGEIIREASAQRITQIVVGKSHRSPLRTRFGGSLVEAVLRGTAGIDVHVVADPAQCRHGVAEAVRPPAPSALGAAGRSVRSGDAVVLLRAGRPRGPTLSATRAGRPSGSSAGGRRATRSGRCSTATSRRARRVAVVGAGNGDDRPAAAAGRAVGGASTSSISTRALRGGRAGGCRATCAGASRSSARTSRRASPTSW